MNKKNIILVLMFAGLTSLTASCDLLEECGTCELVTIDANDQETRGTPLPFCGDQLQNKKDSSPETIGGVTTYWECY